MTSATGAIIKLIWLISVTWSFAVYFVKIIGTLSQYVLIPITSVRLERDVKSLMIILILVLITVLVFKDINKGVMSWFSLSKYDCIHFASFYIYMLLTWTFDHLVCASYTITLITLSHCYCLYHDSDHTASLLLHDSLPCDSDMPFYI